MATTLQQFLTGAAERQRVILIGGLAVIAHGYSRPTKDGDAWLDPFSSADLWAAQLQETMRNFPETCLWSLAERRAIKPSDLEEAAREDGVVRVLGLTDDLDLFYKPNVLECADFDLAWKRALPAFGEVRVMEPLDLLLTKTGTGRDQDQQDIFFLEGVLRRDLGARVRTATLEEARKIFDRYLDHIVAKHALENRDPAVHALAREMLGELAAAGDPFARDALNGLKARG